MNKYVILNMTTEAAIAMATHSNQIPAASRFFSKVLIWNIVPDCSKAVLLEIAHRKVAGIAGEHRAVHLNAGMQPPNIARQFLPYGLTDLIT